MYSLNKYKLSIQNGLIKHYSYSEGIHSLTEEEKSKHIV